MKIEIDINNKDDIMIFLKPLIEKYCHPFLGKKYPKAAAFINSFEYGKSTLLNNGRWEDNRLYTLNHMNDDISFNWSRIYNEKTIEELFNTFLELNEYNKKENSIKNG